MARIGRFGFLGIAIVFHLVYISSIFDIYFVSPIVHGMSSHGARRKPGSEAPAKRLVLFVGDGLRADKAFQSFPDPSPSRQDSPSAQEPRPLAPFLRSKVLKAGTFGVSHTRVPTESRPGHVALIAGLYEDVSSVTTGWKLNPVNFDSVFNRSRHTWSWGSPDILPMFKEGATPGRIDADCYGEEFEDFTKDATMLDTWVFDKVKTMFASAGRNASLDTALRQDRNVFFLHLLGLDTTGHAYRPYSREYLHNIQTVDQGVKEITKVVDDFFGDGKTAYVFTADHGISDWGSHGDGHPDNTRTPLIAWGSGVAPPVVSQTRLAKGHEDGFSADWGFDHIQRNDVEQADVAALMAYLAGLDFPVNSVGQLPLPYLSGDLRAKAEAALANCEGVLEMYRVKEQQKRAKELRYKAFPPLGDESHSIEHRVQEIQKIIESGEYNEAITQSQELFQVGLDGLKYLQTYDWLFLRALVTLGYLGWIAFALTIVIDTHVLQSKDTASRQFMTTASFCTIGVILFSILIMRSAPFTYYLYAIFPLVFWEEVLSRTQALISGFQILTSDFRSKAERITIIIQALCFIIVLESLVLSYFHRSVYTFCFLAAQFWPFIYGREFVKKDKLLMVTWALTCQAMSVFTLLDALKVENIPLILTGGSLMALVGAVYLIFDKYILSSTGGNDENKTSSLEHSSKCIIGVQVGLILLAMVVTSSSASSLQAKQGLPLGNQVTGWMILILSLTVPFLHGLYPNNHYLHRLVIIFLTFSPIFVILTISYEGLFYFAFCATLVTWVRLEHLGFEHQRSIKIKPADTAHSQAESIASKVATVSKNVPALKDALQTKPADLRPSEYRALTISDARVSLFFFFLLQAAFFSTGNIASVSSFSLESVYRLIPVFNPFSQGVLLTLKLMIPFAVISANLGILTRRLGVAPSSLFMVVMAISDILTMNFFWLVRDEGSWLDIGTSISHFVIASLLCVFVAGLEFVSEVFVKGVDIGTQKPPSSDDNIGKGAGSKSAANGHAKRTINGKK